MVLSASRPPPTYPMRCATTTLPLVRPLRLPIRPPGSPLVVAGLRVMASPVSAGCWTAARLPPSPSLLPPPGLRSAAGCKPLASVWCVVSADTRSWACGLDLRAGDRGSLRETPIRVALRWRTRAPGSVRLARRDRQLGCSRDTPGDIRPMQTACWARAASALDPLGPPLAGLPHHLDDSCGARRRRCFLVHTLAPAFTGPARPREPPLQ